MNLLQGPFLLLRKIKGLRGNFSYRHGPLDEIYNKVLG